MGTHDKFCTDMYLKIHMIVQNIYLAQKCSIPSLLLAYTYGFQQVFGDAGKHARSAFGVAQIPLGACVEIEMIVEVSE